MTWGFGPGFNNNNGSSTPQAPPPGVAAPLGGAQPSPFDAAKDAFLTNAGPTFVQYQMDNAGIMRNMGYGNDMLGLNQQDLQNQYNSSMGDLSTQQATNALQSGRSGMDADAYRRMMGFNTDVFEAQAAGLANNAYQQQSQINQQATANGAYVARGTNDNRMFAAKDFYDQYGALAGNYKQQQEMLNMRAGNADVQKQVLDREAQNMGMKASQLQDTLQNGLAKLGLNNQISVGNLLDGIQNNNLQALQLYYQVIQQAGQYASAAGQK